MRKGCQGEKAAQNTDGERKTADTNFTRQGRFSFFGARVGETILREAPQITYDRVFIELPLLRRAPAKERA